MVASLLPVMTMLTSGPLEGLLSPDASPIEDSRPITDLGRIIARQQVAYIGLDALSDGPVATMIGLLLLSDLTAVAGERYNQGIPPTPVNIFIDEAAEIINDPAIQLLNKGRGAGIRMTIATQTIADFTARLGSEAKTLQVLGNVNNLLALRVQDAETQRYVTQNLPTFRRKTILRTLGNATLGPDPHLFTGNLGERLIEEDADLVPSALLGQLADLHYFGKLAGGRVIKGRIPLLSGRQYA
jgi:conjugal transfer pilus assembly protein TraD